MIRRLPALFALCLTAVVAACSNASTTSAQTACGKDPYSSECTCNRRDDCTPGSPEARTRWICTEQRRCLRICASTSECRTGDVCEDAICRPPACASDSQCGGDVCIGGSCKPAPAASDVRSCQVLPTDALLNEGGAEAFSVVARDADGKVLAYKGPIDWSSSAADRASPKAGAVPGVFTGGSVAGSVAVQAAIGTVSCQSASAQNYAAAPSGKLRVVVADLLRRIPVASATVVVDELPAVTTGSDGVALVDVAAGTHTVSVFHATYQYLTMFDVSATDLVAYVKPPPASGTFTGKMSARSFDGLSDPRGTVRLALYGGSIPGNLIDLQVENLVGPSETVSADLLGQGATDISLPSSVVLGLGEQVFKPDFSIPAPVGIRSVWGLGGNANISKLVEAVGPAISGGSDVDTGAVASALLPLLGRLQSGVVTGVEVKQDVTAPLSGFQFDTLLRVRVDAGIPDLPSFTSGTAQKRFDGVVVLGGALHGSQGLVPLGLTAGVDAKTTTADPDGKIDPSEEGQSPGIVSLRMSPLHGGLETSPYAVLALAASLGGLGDSIVGAAEDDGVVLSGLVKLPGVLSAGAPVSVPMAKRFLGVPNPSIDGRTFSVGTPVEDAAYHRLDIGRDSTGEWAVYFPAGVSSKAYTVPTPPAGFADRLSDNAKLLVMSVSLGQPGTGASDYDGVLAFDGDDIDDLTTRIDAFSTREIVRAR
ncbi:MAG: hypothetical protein RL199_1314 [Pseudomonadota bacterium]|jgi:hypothetical protein